MKNKFGFILVKPHLGENIGACARSMKNFGFSKLYIVDPKINFPNNKAKATSVGAYDIINNAKTFTKTFSFKLPEKLPPKSEFIVKLKVRIKEVFLQLILF